MAAKVAVRLAGGRYDVSEPGRGSGTPRQACLAEEFWELKSISHTRAQLEHSPWFKALRRKKGEAQSGRGGVSEAEVRHRFGGRGLSLKDTGLLQPASIRKPAGEREGSAEDTQSDHGLHFGKSLPGLRRNVDFEAAPEIERNALRPHRPGGLLQRGSLRHLPAEAPGPDQDVHPPHPHPHGRPGLRGGQHRLRCGLYHDPGLRLEASVEGLGNPS